MTNSILRAILIAALCIVAPVIAESREVGSGEPRSRGINDPKHDKARTMRECDEHITECGVMDKTKIITRPATTIRVTKKVTTVTTTRLPDITNTITMVDVKTINDKIQGHCRNTTEYIDPKPATVTEYETVELVKEIVSIVNTTTTRVSYVHGTTIEQCFIKTGRGPFHILHSTQTAAEVPEASQSHSPPVSLVEDSERETVVEQVVQEQHAEQAVEGFSDDLTGNLFGEMGGQ